jgi:hypothetical protein
MNSRTLPFTSGSLIIEEVKYRNEFHETRDNCAGEAQRQLQITAPIFSSERPPHNEEDRDYLKIISMEDINCSGSQMVA